MWHDELRKMKAASGLSTQQISNGSGIPNPTLEKIFSGATKEPKLPTIQQLVHFLGYTLDDLTPKSSEAQAIAQGLLDEENALLTNYRQSSAVDREALSRFAAYAAQAARVQSRAAEGAIVAAAKSSLDRRFD